VLIYLALSGQFEKTDSILKKSGYQQDWHPYSENDLLLDHELPPAQMMQSALDVIYEFKQPYPFTHPLKRQA
jgi:hypothetical protein